jgi:hypothetical protein
MAMFVLYGDEAEIRRHFITAINIRVWVYEDMLRVLHVSRSS